MASEEINKYIEQRYDRWLDYSTYHCSQARMSGEEVDVLNEVLYMLLQKDSTVLDGLLSRKKGKYTELDFFILQMLKLNITSNTSPYRHRYKAIPKDENADWQRLDLIDEKQDVSDKSDRILSMYNQARSVFDTLQLSDFARRVFSYRFFEDESFSDWPGDEDKKILYETYNKVVKLIKDRINNKILF